MTRLPIAFLIFVLTFILRQSVQYAMCQGPQLNDASTIKTTLTDTIRINPAAMWVIEGVPFAKGKPTNCTRVVIKSSDYVIHQKESPSGDLSSRSSGLTHFSLNGVGFRAEVSDGFGTLTSLWNIGAEHIYSSELFNAPAEENRATYVECRGTQSELKVDFDKEGLAKDFQMKGILTSGHVSDISWRLSFIIKSDPKYPLTFKIIPSGSYMYLCGRGILISENDLKAYLFGINDRVEHWILILDNPDPIRRQGAVQALGWLGQKNQQAVVGALTNALVDPDMDVRRDAAEALGRLGSIKSTETLKTAIEALKAATKDSDEWAASVAKEVLLKITSNDKLDIAVDEKQTAQTILVDIAKGNGDLSVRKAAVDKLTDQTLLADVAQNALSWIIRRDAVNKLTDQVLLADIVRKDTASFVRKAAQSRLNLLQSGNQ